MQDALQGAQEEAVQAAFSVYNVEAVGNGPVRRNYEKQLHATLKRHFEVMLHIAKTNSLCSIFSAMLFVFLALYQPFSKFFCIY